MNDRYRMNHTPGTSRPGDDSADGTDPSPSGGSITDGTGPDPDLAQGESE